MIVSRGDEGEAVSDIQQRLTALGHTIDSVELEANRFDSSTESATRAFQQERALLTDGIVGPQTWQELVEAGYSLGDRVLYLRYPSFRGDDVRTLQERLNVLGFDPGREDGIFGEQADRAVREFQENVGISPDGIVGAATLRALDRLRPPGPGPGRTVVRETESLEARGSLSNRRIAIDPGHGPLDPGAVGPGGLLESEAVLPLSQALADTLQNRGAEPVFLRTPEESPGEPERAGRANAADADIVISIHANSHTDPAAAGSACYFFGRPGSVSLRGQALAELVQEEIIETTGMSDGRTHPMAFPLLRETRMPAVRIEPCFITNPNEEELLRGDEFRRDVAEAIVRALERFFAGGGRSD